MRAPALPKILLLSLLTLIPGLSGCVVDGVFKVRIPDFVASSVAGARVWEVDAAGNPVEAATYEFTLYDTETYPGAVLLHFDVVLPDGTRTPLSTFAVEDPAVPGSLDVLLRHPTPKPAFYRVSSFNTHGESSLSADEVWLQ